METSITTISSHDINIGKMNMLTGLSCRLNGVKLCKGLYRLGFQNVAIDHVDLLAAFTGFSYQKKYGCFARTRKRGRNNEVTVLMR